MLGSTPVRYTTAVCSPFKISVKPSALGSVDDQRTFRLLGSVITPWASLATLLWRESCRARGVWISARQFTLLGLVGVPLVVAATLLDLKVAGLLPQGELLARFGQPNHRLH